MSASLPRRALRFAARVTPGRIAARVDRLRPGLADEFGGPFNGQAKRIEAIREVLDRGQFRSIIETGTYRATTTLFLREISDAPIATIEVNSRFYYYAKDRLRGVPNVMAIHGDSASELRALAGKPPWNQRPTFFYLDAHWQDALPLQGELEAIRAGWSDYAVIVDDFRVPDDPGYAYDDYGPGAVLESGILAPLASQDVAVYWPTAHSSTESGARRGWVTLASPGLVDASLRGADGLRPGGSLASVIENAERSRPLAMDHP